MKKSLIAVLVVLAALAVSTTLLATMDFQKEFSAKYPDAKAKLGKCSTCHAVPLPKKEGNHELNPYGKELQKTINPKAEKKTLDFAKVEPLSSAGDGVKNIDKIKEGKPPAEKSK